MKEIHDDTEYILYNSMYVYRYRYKRKTINKKYSNINISMNKSCRKSWDVLTIITIGRGNFFLLVPTVYKTLWHTFTILGTVTILVIPSISMVG